MKMPNAKYKTPTMQQPTMQRKKNRQSIRCLCQGITHRAMLPNHSPLVFSIFGLLNGCASVLNTQSSRLIMSGGLKMR